jgi:hypothetical protein
MKLGTPILILLSGVLLTACSGNKLPKVKDPEALYKECVALWSEFPDEVTRTNRIGRPIRVEPQIPREKWTTAIVALKPSAVVKGEFGIYIFTEPEKEYLGYYVFITAQGPPDSRLQLGAYNVSRPDAEMDFQGTGMKRIYKFTVVPIL